MERGRLGRRVRAELVCQERAAALVHAQRLGPVAGGSVCLHQAPIAGFVERLERDRLIGPSHRFSRIAGSQGRVGERGERTGADVRELAPLRLDPAAVLCGQERLLCERDR